MKKSYNPIIKLSTISTVFIFSYLSYLSISNIGDAQKVDAYQNSLQECEWSIDRNFFHTEGIFTDGSLWQISSLDGKFYRSDYGNGNDRRIQLKDYNEAVAISNQLVKDGFGCDCYDY